jgi:hypothetical protein
VTLDWCSRALASDLIGIEPVKFSVRKLKSFILSDQKPVEAAGVELVLSIENT